MKGLKIRKVKADFDSTYHYIVLDTCEKIQERAKEEGNYSCAIKFKGDNGKLLPLDDVYLSYDVDIASTDRFRKLTTKEYYIVSVALKKNKLKFNKKTGMLCTIEGKDALERNEE